jgi:hypothetical protein
MTRVGLVETAEAMADMPQARDAAIHLAILFENMPCK